MRYIGIDPGTQCGWAVLDEDGNRLVSGEWNLSGNRWEGAGMRFVKLQVALRKLIEAHINPDDVLEDNIRLGIEEVRAHQGTDAAHVYGGILASVQLICESFRLPYMGIPVATAKRVATGKGNSGKPNMLSAAMDRWKPDDWPIPFGENEVDALWIAEALRQQLS